VLLTMLLLAGLFEQLPSATLGAVVIDAMVGLITLVDLRRYYRVNRADWLFFMGAGLGILFIGITQGILIGVVLSLLLLIARSSRTSVRELGHDPRTGQYHVLSRHEGLQLTPGVRIARIDGPLFFADADGFRTRIHEITADDGGPVRLVVDAEAVLLTDTDGADMLKQVAAELAVEGSQLQLASVHPPVLGLWERAGLIDALGDGAVFASVDDAVAAAERPLPVRAPSSSR
jgi:sulfate permease, SulP family